MGGAGAGVQKARTGEATMSRRVLPEPKNRMRKTSVWKERSEAE
jgi:hypothetical protein